jgi:hypothetical protein
VRSEVEKPSPLHLFSWLSDGETGFLGEWLYLTFAKGGCINLFDDRGPLQ